MPLIYHQLNMQWGKLDISAQYDTEQKKNTSDAYCCISARHTLGAVIGCTWMRTITWLKNKVGGIHTVTHAVATFATF